MAIMTFVVTGLTFVVCLALLLWYRFFKLQKLMDEDIAESSFHGFETLQCSNVDRPDPTNQPPPYSCVSFDHRFVFTRD